MSPMLYTCETCAKIGPWGTSRRCPEHPPHDDAKQRRFRIAVLSRDGHKCRRCGSRGPLVAHHWPIPLRALPAADAYDPRHGLTVCDDCHKAMDHYAR